MIAAAPDAGYGAFVAWGTSAIGPVRVAHLLADGTADPSLPTGGLALSTGLVQCTGLDLIADQNGGAFIHWQEGKSLYLTRVLGTGATAPGWNARGRRIGTITSSAHRPWTQADGSGGLFIGWFQGNRSDVTPSSVLVMHVGADGQGAGGWPNTARTLPLDPKAAEWVPSASFAVAADGGVWVLIATGRIEDGVGSAGEWRLGRFMPNGATDPSLPEQGVFLAPFDAVPLALHVPIINFGAVVDDGEGGVLTGMGYVSSPTGTSWGVSVRLERRLADGSPHPGQGSPRYVGGWGEFAVGMYNATCSCDPAFYSVRLMRDVAGEFAVASTESSYGTGYQLSLRSIDAFGAPLGDPITVRGGSPDLKPTPDGGFVVASYGGDPLYSPYRLDLKWSDGRAVTLQQSPYDFIAAAIAPLPDRGAITFWSAPSGYLYAQRVGANGSALDVSPPALAHSHLLLAGSGRDVIASWPVGAPGTLRVHDVMGRNVAQHAIGSEAGTARLTLQGAAPTGLYFGRLARRDGSVATARVFVLR